MLDVAVRPQIYTAQLSFTIASKEEWAEKLSYPEIPEHIFFAALLFPEENQILVRQ